MTAARQVRARRRLEPAPPEALEHWVGDCGECLRAMARSDAITARPELTRYFVGRGRLDLCKTCWARARPPQVGRSVRRAYAPGASPVRRGRRSARYDEEQLARIRAALPCLGCGAVPGPGGLSEHRDGCPVAGLAEGE